MKESNNILIEKWLQGTLTDEERSQLQASGELQKLERLDRAIQAFKAPAYDVEQELERALAEDSTPVVSMYRHVWKAAAVFVLITAAVVLYFFQAPQATTVMAEAQNTELHYLPDSSKVWLNAGARLTYNKEQWNENREVALTGEAFFEVRKGERFTVTSEPGTVEVLGTQFNVRSYNEYYEVACYEGSVRVANIENKIILKPNQLARSLDLAPLELRNISAMNRPAWIAEGLSQFERVPFKVVVKALETQYGITISPVDSNEMFTGSFPNNNLNVALDAVMIPVGYAYEIAGDEVILKRE
ncbi:FecR family protein [Marinoscillum furvescens]|uniref:FecR family protein n=1 Tax=Marinoscillum furvescens DSM 4134 TaxID=1122208 RepID=A0A3D9L1T3_MARFU|nr:FecR domain-containing protein [Marinoscillum furvescens]RED97862.1 FecR family protein [Marinoscillum furvescens DSM 4134]